MLKALFPIILLQFLFACEARPKPPVNCLSKEKMGEIIADMLIAEAALNKNILNNGLADSSIKISILKDQKISYPLYESSYKYYCYEPNDLKSIYEIAKEIIQSKKQMKHY
jgi:Domain of unknown function (DUF4296)